MVKSTRLHMSATKHPSSDIPELTFYADNDLLDEMEDDPDDCDQLMSDWQRMVKFMFPDGNADTSLLWNVISSPWGACLDGWKAADLICLHSMLKHIVKDNHDLGDLSKHPLTSISCWCVVRNRILDTEHETRLADLSHQTTLCQQWLKLTMRFTSRPNDIVHIIMTDCKRTLTNMFSASEEKIILDMLLSCHSWTEILFKSRMSHSDFKMTSLWSVAWAIVNGFKQLPDVNMLYSITLINISLLVLFFLLRPLPDPRIVYGLQPHPSWNQQTQQTFITCLNTGSSWRHCHENEAVSKSATSCFMIGPFVSNKNRKKTKHTTSASQPNQEWPPWCTLKHTLDRFLNAGGIATVRCATLQRAFRMWQKSDMPIYVYCCS